MTSKSYFAIVHHCGEIIDTIEGTTFRSKNPIGIFINSTTSYADLQDNILQKLDQFDRKQVSEILYRLPISISGGHATYQRFPIRSDSDMQVLFYCQSKCPEIRTIELFVRIEEIFGSSGGSAPNVQSRGIEGSSGSGPLLVRSPSFAVYNNQNVNEEGDTALGDSRSSGRLVLETIEPPTQHPPNHEAFVEMVDVAEDVIRDEDEESVNIPYDSDDNQGNDPKQVTPQSGILVISDNHPAIQAALNAEGSGCIRSCSTQSKCNPMIICWHLVQINPRSIQNRPVVTSSMRKCVAEIGLGGFPAGVAGQDFKNWKVSIVIWFTYNFKVLFFPQGTNGSLNVRVMPPTLLAAEKEEAKAVLMLFLKKEGLSNAIAARTVNKSDPFIDHLVSVLHSKHKSRYLVGRELTTLEIRDALVPYLESLLEEHGDSLVDVVENYPNPPVKEKPAVQVPPPTPIIDSKKLRTVSRVNAIDTTAGNLRPHIVYLIEFGMSIEQINGIIRRFPSFAYYSLEGKIKPVVEFFLELGVPKEDIPTILTKRPQLCGISLSENLKPTMKFLESLGVDKKQWAKVIYRFPALLTYSREKVEESIDFLRESGLSDDNIGKILTRCPNIVSYSVEDNLRPTANYFRSLGVDVGVLLFRCPQNFGLSIEANLKPVTQFFLEKGYTLDEIGTMISRFGALYTFSLSDNLIPKWDFFITMGYPNSELVKFPQFFGYSLEERIKPRYARMKRAGVRLLLNQVLSLSSRNFEEALEKKLKKNSS
ncbi:hypothetical protein Ahy_B10g106216 isoform A [Arachis hypogaea]|uniref:Uncharacterized protein n=1 Tax=Arachis hypogaea TaxID=3818 RepID=A0A444XA20_ARAHY|nr:hypothetical protein Ahy_B10g106216 isoform A [Arachis hypogaea]